MANTEHFKYLYERWLSNQATPVESDEFFELIAENQSDDHLMEMLGKTWDQIKAAPGQYGLKPISVPVEPAQIISIKQQKGKRLVYRIAAAASILLLLGAGTYFLFFNNKKQTEIVKSNPQDVEAPKETKAMITLADGRTISIEELTTIDQSTARLTKTADGKIIYSREGGKTGSDEIIFNTLTNPRGSRVIDMTLSDGSQVWLNAGSSVTYPVAFVGNERRVTITGEAYFEITHNKTKPFIVSKGDVNVQVLGTHFNLNAYDDEPEIRVTLLEGKVMVTRNSSINNHSSLVTRNSSILTRGQQAIIGTDIRVLNEADLETVMAWKNGRFHFSAVSIETIMKVVSRWYNVDVVYKGKIEGHFVVDMSSEVEVSRLLEVLELTNRVHFTIEGNKIIVKQ